MSLGDLFPKSFRQNFAKRNINIGDAILIKISSLNINYPKYIILVSENTKEDEMAYVIINTEINENVFPTPYLKSLHLKIKKNDFQFLDHDSFIDCSDIKAFNKQELYEFIVNNPERALCNINPDLLKKIHCNIIMATTISPHLKNKFGF